MTSAAALGRSDANAALALVEPDTKHKPMAKMTVDQRVAFGKLLEELRKKWHDLHSEEYSEREARRDAIKARERTKLGRSKIEAELSRLKALCAKVDERLDALDAKVDEVVRDSDETKSREQEAADLAYREVQNAVIATEDAEVARNRVDAFIREIEAALAK